MKRIILLVITISLVFASISVYADESNVKKINVENKTIYLERYESERIVYYLSPENAATTDVTFKSSDTAVATVDSEGEVYAKRTGSATITIAAKNNNITATVKVYVTDYYEEDYDSVLKNIYITYDGEIVKDKLEVMETTTVQLSIKPSPSTASKKVKWRSSNKNIATVDSNGKVTGIKKGNCTIYATSTVNSSKKDSVIIDVTDYVKYPDKIIVSPHTETDFKTGNTIFFIATLYPESTTEKEIFWEVDGGAVIAQDGLLTIYDSGEISVKAYSSNYKTFGEYKFNAVYSDEHFKLIGTSHNLLNDKKIEIYFDSDVNTYSAATDIFATAESSGNGEQVEIVVKTTGKKILISPKTKWPDNVVYIFIKDSLYDIRGNQLGENLKYKLNIRGNVYDK